jgi:hypothetical protein
VNTNDKPEGPDAICPGVKADIVLGSVRAVQVVPFGDVSTSAPEPVPTVEIKRPALEL